MILFNAILNTVIIVFLAAVLVEAFVFFAISIAELIRLWKE